MDNWENVKKYHLDPPEPKVFNRLSHIEDDYQHYQKLIKENNVSINDVVLSNVFGSLDDTVKWTIIPNEFPYYLGENIDHLLLWIHPTCSFNTKQIETIINNELNETEYVEWIFFQNKKNNRSVDGIEHYHIMVLK